MRRTRRPRGICCAYAPRGSAEQVYSAGGASLLVCRTTLTAPRSSVELDVYTVAWRPRSEDVLESLDPGSLRSPRCQAEGQKGPVLRG